MGNSVKIEITAEVSLVKMEVYARMEKTPLLVSVKTDSMVYSAKITLMIAKV